jgi:hypothetical protein
LNRKNYLKFSQNTEQNSIKTSSVKNYNKNNLARSRLRPKTFLLRIAHSAADKRRRSLLRPSPRRPTARLRSRRFDLTIG